jgi:hypothetical protein
MNSRHLGNAVKNIFTSAATLGLAATTLIVNTSALAQNSAGPRLPTGPTVPTLPRVPVVPEVNAGLVLIPIAIAILLLASRQLLRRRTAQQR